MKTIIRARPGKTFLFNKINGILNDSRGRIGLDAGAAGFKNISMFKTDIYVGVDINKEALQLGLSKVGDRDAVGIVSSLDSLDRINNSSVDVVVSTNTFHQIDHDIQAKAIAQLSQITKINGLFICELLIDDNFDKLLDILKNNFNDIKIYYYKNLLSQIYEKLMQEKSGRLDDSKFGCKKLFLLVSYLLSLLEYLTCGARSINKHALVICRSKKGDKNNSFNLDGFEKIGNQLYG